MDRLKGKVALISGAARGQGAAEARLFASEGAMVVLGDVRDELLKQTADAINAKLGSKVAESIHLDVTRAADWRRAIETGVREYGGLDILVNNAGIANMKGLEQTSEEEWDAIVNVNQKGVWLGMKTAIPAMRKRAWRLDYQYLFDLRVARIGSVLTGPFLWSTPARRMSYGRLSFHLG
jgi:NAD(P)-dependent dehydrogenase (short-subunit alcohol dehydrogenase family)